MPSESEETPSRQFVIHKAQSEGGEYKFSDNPIVAWFLRGNPLLKTGIVVLFLGLAFLLRYASERVHVPVELRYLTVAGAGFGGGGVGGLFALFFCAVFLPCTGSPQSRYRAIPEPLHTPRQEPARTTANYAISLMGELFLARSGHGALVYRNGR